MHIGSAWLGSAWNQMLSKQYSRFNQPTRKFRRRSFDDFNLVRFIRLKLPEEFIVDDQNGCDVTLRSFIRWQRMHALLGLKLPKEFIVEDVRLLSGQIHSIDACQMMVGAMELVTLTLDGIDTSQYFPDVIAHLTNSDLIIKKLVCWYISRTTTNVDNALLVVNSLTQNCNDPNPLVRCLAIKTFTSMQHVLISEYAMPLVINCLNDENVFVRRASILGCAKICRINPSLFSQFQTDVIQQLQTLLLDSDIIVVYNALSVLNEILSKQWDGASGNEDGEEKNTDGLVVSKGLATFLVSKLETFSDVHKPTILSVILRYDFKDPQETLQFMNALDRYFKADQHIPACVTSAVTSAFVAMVTSQLPHLKTQVLRRSSDCLLGHLKSDKYVITWSLFRFIEDFVANNAEIFSGSYKLFMCTNSDPEYLKVQKLKMLSSLTTSSNFSEIHKNMMNVHKKTSNTDIHVAVIKSLSAISQRKHFKYTCLKTILNLIKTKPQIRETSVMLVELLKHDILTYVREVSAGGKNTEENIGASSKSLKCSRTSRNLDSRAFLFNLIKLSLDSLGREGLSEEAVIRSLSFLGDVAMKKVAELCSADQIISDPSTDDASASLLGDRSDGENGDTTKKTEKTKNGDDNNDVRAINNDPLCSVDNTLDDDDDDDGGRENNDESNNNFNNNDVDIRDANGDDDDDVDGDDDNSCDNVSNDNDLFAGIRQQPLNNYKTAHLNKLKFTSSTSHNDDDDDDDDGDDDDDYDKKCNRVKTDIDRVNGLLNEIVNDIPYRLEAFLKNIEKLIYPKISRAINNDSIICNKAKFTYNCDNYNGESNVNYANVLSALLTTFSRLFTAEPAVYQHMLGRTLEICKDFGHVDLRFKSDLYYCLLRIGVGKLKEMLNS
ncbi:hypothetical protein HELRODRAFT_194538 [Helobdella robusta]|uniref:Clathrin/coatomer adaptor adaptin-like N-terminal domain-containing protein n=1 Tax=Helobdella robusta TaxID=6412 RepID=T1FW62_HELRO|nr:hypothetical protein HELRODRAFT_194538 [Helobdella robusta]ESN91141.1 hypothetical protein HELRODRAFT_194538 [Helobdella robusta]